ncbi:MAG: B12-binding domain-containing radical SAM protein [Planctomycetota bacterium]|jgi:radical SAM superfamily enzyme YgiQ (UPF0313 family)
MKLKIVYPSWPKLERQTEFHLPPHGPVVFAATIPEDVDIIFEDDNVEQINFDEHVDLAAISTMLTCQLPRAFEIAAEFRARNVPVIFGGISTILHSEEVALHADSVFLGETEGSFSKVLEDFENGRLQPIYDYMNDQPDIGLIGPARRDILKRELYNYRGVQMLDLVHASRGCKFDCFPCCSGFLGGRKFRPRPIDKVIAEMEQIPNNRLFIVDNSLAQDRDWLIELFTAMKPLKKKWVSHPILYDEEVLKLASEAGCWYIYQAIFDTSDMIRDRIKMLKDFEIGIEGTIILGLDDQDVDYIKRLVDFLCENEVDVAEFTILTPFPHSPIRQQMEKDGRILHNNWIEYTADKVVFQPLKMTPEELQDVYYYAWDTFYADSGYELRMGQLFQKLVMREIADNTYKRYDTRKPRRSISAKK